MSVDGTGTICKNFRINSLWDPEYSSGIGQVTATPLITMTPFYKEYRVIGCKIEVTACLRED